MDEIVAAYPKARLKVILDNLNTHKKNDEWLKRRPLVTFHFTPTRASWLNQVECWFSILQGQSPNGTSSGDSAGLHRACIRFIDSIDEEHRDKNFSDCPLWDQLFGTWYGGPNPPSAYGIADRAHVERPRNQWQSTSGSSTEMSRSQ